MKEAGCMNFETTKFIIIAADTTKPWISFLFTLAQWLRGNITSRCGLCQGTDIEKFKLCVCEGENTTAHAGA